MRLFGCLAKLFDRRIGKRVQVPRCPATVSGDDRRQSTGFQNREGPSSKLTHKPGDLPGCYRCPFAGKAPESDSSDPGAIKVAGFIVLEMTVEKACLQVYTGPGKGKTTAATGLIVRALGRGMKVLLVRFLKSNDLPSSELNILEKISGLEIVTAGVGGVEARHRPEELKQNVRETFLAVRPKILSGAYDLVVLDEFNGVLHYQYLPLADGLELLDKRPTGTELVLTGRNAPEEILQRADLVTVMQAERHPYEQGVHARPGIEY